MRDGSEAPRGSKLDALVAALRSQTDEHPQSLVFSQFVAMQRLVAQRLEADPRTVLRQWPETGVLNWRPAATDSAGVIAALEGTSSAFTIGETVWVRQVAANPHAEVDAIWARISAALG